MTNPNQWCETDDQEIGDDGGVWLPDTATDDTDYDPTDDPAATPVAEAPGSPSRSAPKLPVAAAKIPAWLQNNENGKVPHELLLKVAPISGGYLIPEAAAAWRMLQLAAQHAGFNLTMTGGYRTYDQQAAMFQERYSTVNTGGSSKVWNGTTYWLKPNVAMAAVPGRSNHGWGAAVDMALGGYGQAAKNVLTNSAFMTWILPRAKDYGWSWEVQSEAWHIRLVGDGQRLTDSSGKSAGISPASTVGGAPSYPVPTHPLQVGSRGGQVAALQNLCIWFKWASFTRADGDFGTLTEDAVKQMQTQFGVESLGVYGPKTAAALSAFLVGK